jgi:hypothetical protein
VCPYRAAKSTMSVDDVQKYSETIYRCVKLYTGVVVYIKLIITVTGLGCSGIGDLRELPQLFTAMFVSRLPVCSLALF